MRDLLLYTALVCALGCMPGRTYPKSDHCDGHLFFMPGVEVNRGLGDVLRWQLFDRKTPWPKQCPATATPTPAQKADAEKVVVTSIGHATHLIEHAGKAILTDPMFSPRASPLSWLGPKRLCPPGLALAALPPSMSSSSATITTITWICPASSSCTKPINPLL